MLMWRDVVISSTKDHALSLGSDRQLHGADNLLRVLAAQEAGAMVAKMSGRFDTGTRANL